MKGLYFSICLSLICVLPLKAQDGLEGDYLLFALQAQTDRQIDNFHSPLNYHGWNAMLNLGWHSYQGRWMSNFDFSGSIGLANPYEFGSELRNGVGIGGRIHYSLRFRIWEKEKHQLLLGLYNQNFFNYRDLAGFSNSSESYAGFFGYGPSIAYTYSRKAKAFGRDFNWSWQSEVNIPLGTIVIRPGFSRQLSGGEFNYLEHHLLSGAQQVDFRHSFIWRRYNGNQIRLYYAWEYLQALEPSPYYYAAHSFGIQMFFAL